MSVEDIRPQKTVAIAGGRLKTDAIRSVLASGLLSGLITDESTAAEIVAKDASLQQPLKLAASQPG
jgi:DNA-binding transcriptional regulator LsrR (DeoR family)